MDDAELNRRVIAASGPPAVDDLTTFLRKRFSERRAAAHGLRMKQAEREVAEIEAQEEILDELDSAVLAGKPGPYIDALLFVAGKFGGLFADHPDYRENWRP